MSTLDPAGNSNREKPTAAAQSLLDRNKRERDLHAAKILMDCPATLVAMDRFREEVQKAAFAYMDERDRWLVAWMTKAKIQATEIVARVNYKSTQTVDGMTTTLFIDGLAVGDHRLRFSKQGHNLEYHTSSRDFANVPV